MISKLFQNNIISHVTTTLLSSAWWMFAYRVASFRIQCAQQNI